MLPEKESIQRELETELAPWQERIDIIRHKLKFVETRPRVACVERIDPLVTAGSRLSAMVEMAGGEPVPAANGRLLFSPVIVILMRPRQRIEETLQEMDALLQSSWFSEISSAGNPQIFIVDAARYFHLSGTVTIDDIEILAEIIGAADFHFGFEGTGWVRFEA